MSKSSLRRWRMRSASAEPPTRTKPSSAGCALRKSQTFSVAGGSKGKPLLDVVQDALDRIAGTLGLATGIIQQFGPFGSHAFKPEFQRNSQQTSKPRTQQCGPDVHGIRRVGIGPNQPRIFLPELSP